MKTLLIGIFFSGFLLGCASKIDMYPEYQLSQEEEARAIKQFKAEGGTILFLLLVDRQGKTLNVDVIDYNRKQINLHTANRFGRKLSSIFQAPFAIASEPDIRKIIRTMNVEHSAVFN